MHSDVIRLQVEVHRQFATVLILLVALALYALDYADLGVAAAMADFDFEIWFGFRLRSCNNVHNKT